MTSPQPVQAEHTLETRLIQSHAFGDVEVSANAIIHFASPLWGFPDRHEYALLSAARQGLFWLQAVDDALTTFILGDPFVIDETYAFDLSDSDRQALRATSQDDVMALVMLTLPGGDGSNVTANFRAPIAFNVPGRTGVQVVTNDDGHPLRRPVDMTIFPAGDGVRML